VYEPKRLPANRMMFSAKFWLPLSNPMCRMCGPPLHCKRKPGRTVWATRVHPAFVWAIVQALSDERPHEALANKTPRDIFFPPRGCSPAE
jgi:hypothetical protein